LKYPTLDLHGAKQEEVFDLLDKFLRREEGRGSSAVRIIHGIGTGKVKLKVYEYCKITGHQPKPDKNEKGQANPGSILLYL
jgi:dsDNA-specific endonuclease/ATPase MutS2